MIQAEQDARRFAEREWSPREVVPFREWMERNVVIPPSINPDRPGPISFRGYEFVLPIFDAIFDPRIRIVIITAPPQFFKTTVFVCSMLYIAKVLGGPQFYVTSVRPKLNEFVDDKLKPIIEASPEVDELIPRDGNGRRDVREYNQTGITFGSEKLMMTWAGSASALSQTTAKWIFGDEPAKWKQVFKQEGGAVGLLKERGKSFPDSYKVVLASTPPQVIDEKNDFWEDHQNGTVERWVMPCPHCEAEHAFSILPEGHDEDAKSKYFAPYHDAKKRKDGTYALDDIIATGHHKCPSCNGRIDDKHKPAMIASGRMFATNPDPDPETRSFSITRMYQPLVTAGGYLADWFKACRSEKAKMHFLLQNEVQPWAPPKRKVEVKAFRHIIHKDKSYVRGTLPKDHTAKLLAAFADEQELEYPYVIFAIDPKPPVKVWAVEWGRLFDPDEVHGVVTTKAEEIGLPFHGGLFDAGHRPRVIYRFCYENQERDRKTGQPVSGWIPAHGRDMDKLFRWSQDLNVDQGMKANPGKKREIKAILWQNFGFKSDLYIDILKQGDEAARESEAEIQLWLPSDAAKYPDLLKQLSAERLVENKRGKMEWQAYRKNDYGDCFCELLVYLELYRGRLAPKKKVNLASLNASGG